MFCSNCGKEIDDKAVVCVNCGCAVGKRPNSSKPDAPSAGFAVIGFLVPLVGLILYLIYDAEQPLKARSAGKGALAGVITSVILSVLFFVIYFVFLGALIYSF